jgi:hypothetical protein
LNQFHESIGDFFETHLLWSTCKLGNRQGNHNICETLKKKPPQHQRSSASSFNDKEREASRNAVGGGVDSRQDTGHEFTLAQVINEYDAEIIIESIDSSQLLIVLACAHLRRTINLPA